MADDDTPSHTHPSLVCLQKFHASPWSPRPGGGCYSMTSGQSERVCSVRYWRRSFRILTRPGNAPWRLYSSYNITNSSRPSSRFDNSDLPPSIEDRRWMTEDGSPTTMSLHVFFPEKGHSEECLKVVVSSNPRSPLFHVVVDFVGHIVIHDTRSVRTGLQSCSDSFTSIM